MYVLFTGALQVDKYKCRWLGSKRERVLIIYLGCAGGFSSQLGTADVQHRNADVPDDTLMSGYQIKPTLLRLRCRI